MSAGVLLASGLYCGSQWETDLGSNDHTHLKAFENGKFPFDEVRPAHSGNKKNKTCTIHSFTFTLLMIIYFPSQNIF